jgi:hypothetical protein
MVPAHDNLKSTLSVLHTTLRYATLRYSSTKRAKTPPVDLSSKALILQQHVPVSSAEPHWDKSRSGNCRLLDQVGVWHRFFAGQTVVDR